MQQSKRIVVITGALRGLGFHLSKRLVKENEVRLIVTSRDKLKAQKSLDELKAINSNAFIDYFPLQTDSEESSQAFAEWVQQKYGHLDVLLNNAGVGEGSSIGQNKYEKAKEILGVNLYGVIQLTEKLLPLLSADGKVLNVSSILGKLSFQSPALATELSNPQIDLAYVKIKADEYIDMVRTKDLVGWREQSFGTSYCASKALLNVYTRFVLPKIFPSPKQVAIAIHPGWVQTDMGGAAAPLKPEEGVVSMHRALIEFPYGRPDLYNGIFIDEKGNKWDY